MSTDGCEARPGHIEQQSLHEVFADARQVLDPLGTLRNYAHQRAEQRLSGEGINTFYKDFMNRTDVLGAARISHAAKAQGLSDKVYRDNVTREVSTTIIEALQTDGHESETRLDVNADGRAHLGELMFDEMVLRGLHPSHSEIINKYGEIDYYSELLSQAHFNNLHMRHSRARVTLSLIPSDQEPNTEVLDEYFKLDSGGWMIDWVSFEPKLDGGWERISKRLFMSGSDPRVANRLLQELGVTDASELLTAADIRERSILVDKNAFGRGPAGLAHMSDTIMSETSGRPFFCGKMRDWVPTEQDYNNLPVESRRREAEMDYHVRHLTQLAHRLVANADSFEAQNQKFANGIIFALRDICEHRPEYAEHTFGLEAMAFYRQAKECRDAGDIRGANAALSDAHELSKTAFICDIQVSISEAAHAEISPFASLEEKYGYDKVHRGKCGACGTRAKLGPCNFCNDCDTQDRLEKGYIKRLIAKKARDRKTGSTFGVLFSGELHMLRLRSGHQPTPLFAGFIHSQAASGNKANA